MATIKNVSEAAGRYTVEAGKNSVRTIPYFGMLAVVFLFLKLGAIGAFAEASFWWFPVIALLPFEALLAVIAVLAILAGVVFAGIFLVAYLMDVCSDMRRNFRQRKRTRLAKQMQRLADAAAQAKPTPIPTGTTPRN